MDKIQKLHELVLDATRITITVHIHPDGDALGSGIALLHYLTESLGKDAVLALPDSIPSSLAFIAAEEKPGTVMEWPECPETVESRLKGSDLLFCLDCNSYSRAGDMEGTLRASKARKILIDHHLNPEADAFDLVFSTIDSSSASEVLFWTLMQMPGIDSDASRLPADCLKAIMTGMTTDTNNFANSVFPSTLDMASRLIAAGVDRDSILSNLYNEYRENRLRLMGFMLSEKLTITPEGAALMILDKGTQKRFDYQQGESEGFVNMPLSIASVRMSIMLTEDEGRFRVSVRSKKGTSANAYASLYCNGGGHELASGGKIRFPEDIPTPDDAKAYILNTTATFLGK